MRSQVTAVQENLQCSGRCHWWNNLAFLAHSPSLINALWVLNTPPVMAMNVINSWWWIRFQESKWLSFSCYLFFDRKPLFCQLLTRCLDPPEWKRRCCWWPFGWQVVAKWPRISVRGRCLTGCWEQPASTRPWWHGCCPWWVQCPGTKTSGWWGLCLDLQWTHNHSWKLLF